MHATRHNTQIADEDIEIDMMQMRYDVMQPQTHTYDYATYTQ